MAETARIDKWLWASRIFKTRSIAADACKNGRVVVNNANVKPSRPLKVGEVVHVRKPPITYSFRVLKCIEQRVGAKLVPEIYENVTDPKQYELTGDEPHQRIHRPPARHGPSHQKGSPRHGCLYGSRHLRLWN